MNRHAMKRTNRGRGCRLRSELGESSGCLERGDDDVAAGGFSIERQRARVGRLDHLEVVYRESPPPRLGLSAEKHNYAQVGEELEQFP